MRFVIRPVQDPQREIDLKHRLTAAIAEELWERYGGNEQLNWVEAELHLQRLLEWARREARAEAIEEARREGDEARERLFVMVTRMDGVAVADSIPERQLASRRNDGSKGRLPGASADGRRDSRSVAVRSRGTGRNHARDRVGAA